MSTRHCLQTTRAADNRQPWLGDLLLMRHVTRAAAGVRNKKRFTPHSDKIKIQTSIYVLFNNPPACSHAYIRGSDKSCVAEPVNRVTKAYREVEVKFNEFSTSVLNTPRHDRYVG